MERGIWIEQGEFEELCLLVRDLAVCQRRIVAWLDRRGSGAGGVMLPSAPMSDGSAAYRRDRRVRRVRTEESPGSARPVHSREVGRALGYIESHYGEAIGLTRVARHVGCSRSHLARAFRREVGQTMGEHVQRVRLGRALSCMQSGDKVEAAMLDVGYRSKGHFYRLFKNRMGATPGTFQIKP